jgi:GR25 family glycosyltransferase involved in LPS biosynthesis
LIVLNDKNKDPMGNFMKALEAAEDDAAVHLEDDVILTKNFIQKAEQVISENPARVVQFFSMRKDDLSVGTRIDKGRNFIAALCFYLPPKMSKGLRGYFPRWERIDEHPTGLDLTIADFLKKTRQDYLVYCPNLADHRVGKSAIDSRRRSDRVSKTFINPA